MSGLSVSVVPNLAEPSQFLLQATLSQALTSKYQVRGNQDLIITMFINISTIDLLEGSVVFIENLCDNGVCIHQLGLLQSSRHK